MFYMSKAYKVNKLVLFNSHVYGSVQFGEMGYPVH